MPGFLPGFRRLNLPERVVKRCFHCLWLFQKVPERARELESCKSLLRIGVSWKFLSAQALFPGKCQVPGVYEKLKLLVKVKTSRKMFLGRIVNTFLIGCLGTVSGPWFALRKLEHYQARVRVPFWDGRKARTSGPNGGEGCSGHIFTLVSGSASLPLQGPPLPAPLPPCLHPHSTNEGVR